MKTLMTIAVLFLSSCGLVDALMSPPEEDIWDFSKECEVSKITEPHTDTKFRVNGDGDPEPYTVYYEGSTTYLCPDGIEYTP